jgi:hypothetical protein
MYAVEQSNSSKDYILFFTCFKITLRILRVRLFEGVWTDFTSFNIALLNSVQKILLHSHKIENHLDNITDAKKLYLVLI